MTEEEAQRWLGDRFGERGVHLLAQIAAAVRREAEQQNLIAPSTLDAIWSRHILDSAQLVDLAPVAGMWLDIGTGAGFPGLVVAALRHEPTLLVEPRRRRAAFLQEVAERLGLSHVSVHQAKVEQIAAPAAVISARAVAPVEKLLHAASACATSATRWLLPRGRSGEAELAEIGKHWAGEFHVKQSLSDPTSSILLLDRVSPRPTPRRKGKQ